MKLICTAFAVFIIRALCFSQSSAMINSQLDSLFRSYFQDDKPGGAVLIISNHKKVYAKGFGVEDINTQKQITPATLFNVGSISKTFVAYGILKLEQEKKLSIDDKLLKYFPDFLYPGIVENVRLVHLLTHSSGLPDNRNVKDNHDYYLWAKDEENFAPLKKATHLEFEPGSRYKYSNPAFNGLALIIEKLTGMQWQDYITRNIFKPAGMTTSTITDGSHPESGVSHGYVKNANGGYDEMDYGEEPTFPAAGNGGVWSSVEELWKYELAIQGHIFLSAKNIARSRTIYEYADWRDSMPSRLGISWFINDENNLDMIGHTGSQGGFISDYCWLPGKNIFYVLLCNTPVAIKDIRNRVFEILNIR
jgi:CubicO group peptidase (beta-lactamase class C family)